MHAFFVRNLSVAIFVDIWLFHYVSVVLINGGDNANPELTMFGFDTMCIFSLRQYNLNCATVFCFAYYFTLLLFFSVSVINTTQP